MQCLAKIPTSSIHGISPEKQFSSDDTSLSVFTLECVLSEKNHKFFTVSDVRVWARWLWFVYKIDSWSPRARNQEYISKYKQGLQMMHQSFTNDFPPVIVSAIYHLSPYIQNWQRRHYLYHTYPIKLFRMHGISTYTT